ncbi:MAG TPA: hypothetical protein VMA77_16850 [Solirubrobacteraceae bacterium]|nr:hypothetical protein [Solirubrobacteraceae bacterium]
MLMLDVRRFGLRQALERSQTTTFDTTMIGNHMVGHVKKPRQRPSMLAATGCTPAVSPHEHVGRDVLGVNRADIPQETPTMTVVQLRK